MNPWDIVLIVLGSLFLVGFFVVLFLLIRVEEKLEAKDKDKYIPPKRDIGDIDHYEPEEKEIRARVIDMACSSRLIGTKEPKSFQSFVIYFEDEYQKQFSLSVPEEYYSAFDIGQSGVLTLRDGEFYSFELEE